MCVCSSVRSLPRSTMFAMNHSRPHVLPITSSWSDLKAAAQRHILFYYEIPTTSANRSQVEPCKHTRSKKRGMRRMQAGLRARTHSHSHTLMHAHAYAWSNVIKFSDWKAAQKTMLCCVIRKWHLQGGVPTKTLNFMTPYTTFPRVTMHKTDLGLCSKIECLWKQNLAI